MVCNGYDFEIPLGEFGSRWGPFWRMKHRLKLRPKSDPGDLPRDPGDLADGVQSPLRTNHGQTWGMTGHWRHSTLCHKGKGTGADI